ncbi:PP2C family protein-serine/threonine phosphatase [uncultured Jatrophihabitans sp.]|uniref:PP2C family protein-serine/threonine phosphatase n=1 Tax=uncultured Jatrophihabitans sp. TaxID=1610747 RepID=UPI0035CBB9E6
MTSFAAAARTDRGRVRASNEDSVVVTDRLAAVADGLGGHAAGEVASGIAVERMRVLGEQPRVAPEDVLSAVVEANRLIVESAARNLGQAGMGTTLCGVALGQVGETDQCVVFNVGDSRVYNVRDGALVQLSVDHSEVEELRAAGQLSAEAAARYPRRNVITRCLGSDPSPTPDLWVFPPTDGERFLVCSDGLTGEVDDAAIAQLLRQHAEPEPAAHALVDAALAAGGRDNIAVVVVNVSS